MSEVREIRWLADVGSLEDGTLVVIIAPDMNGHWDSYDMKDEIAKAFEVKSYEVKLCYVSKLGGQVYLHFDIPGWWDCE
jgi:hypothetical protein